MQINRGQNFKQAPLNIVGSSTFGRYPKISVEKTYNLFQSDDFLVPYSGYQAIRDARGEIISLGNNGRGLFTSVNLNRMIAVVGNKVYALNVIFNPRATNPYQFNQTQVGTLDTFDSDVFIAENNAGQVAISDSSNIYIYNPNGTTIFQKVTTDFIPGFITFQDTYFICAASQDTFYSPPANNTWRLSAQNDGTSWPSDAAHIGLLETKPDTVVGVARFPSRGNLLFVFGQTVTEPWFNVGYQLFPYQRNSNFNIDYGCANPATIASIDEIVAWLGQNEKSGPIILYSDGGVPKKITTDGIDYLLSQMQNPLDSEAFMYRQDGHLFYHINFYTDNTSLFYDFNTDKFYHASDENMNYFIAKQVAFFKNQYYFVTKNNGNIYAFDTIYTTYDGEIIPRIRTCRSIRERSQEDFIVNDTGFTIEQGTTNYDVQNLGAINLTTEDGDPIITEGLAIFLETEDDNLIITEDGDYLIGQANDTSYEFLISEQDNIVNTVPCVDMSFSIDGGESFGNYVRYEMNPIGQRKNQLRWWNQGLANDFVPQFRFWGMGRFTATDGIVNIRI